MAETTYTPFQSEPAAPVRLIVRRVQPTNWPSSSPTATTAITAGKTLVPPASRDRERHSIKYGVGLNHLPSFAANAAWLAVQVMAHNLARWTGRLGLGEQVVTSARPSGGGSSPSPEVTRPGPCSAPALALGNPVQSSLQRPETRHPATVPANSRQVGQRASLACGPDLAQRRHRGPPNIPLAWLPGHIYWIKPSPSLSIASHSTHMAISLRWIRAKGLARCSCAPLHIKVRVGIVGFQGDEHL